MVVQLIKSSWNGFSCANLHIWSSICWFLNIGELINLIAVFAKGAFFIHCLIFLYISGGTLIWLVELREAHMFSCLHAYMLFLRWLLSAFLVITFRNILDVSFRYDVLPRGNNDWKTSILYWWFQKSSLKVSLSVVLIFCRCKFLVVVSIAFGGLS